MTGDSGVVSSEEVEPGQRVWLGLEKVDVTGEDVLEPADESRECPGMKW